MGRVNDLGAALFAKVGQVLQAGGMKVGNGIVVDATIIAAPRLDQARRGPARSGDAPDAQRQLVVLRITRTFPGGAGVKRVTIPIPIVLNVLWSDATMEHIVRLAVDLAKQAIQLHELDSRECPALRRLTADTQSMSLGTARSGSTTGRTGSR